MSESCLKGCKGYVYEGGSFFVDPEHMTNMQLFWAFCSYGYVLFVSANMIGDGAELLLFVPKFSGVVGSIIIPILGAVPDGMMVLFSGVGDVSKAQYNVAVGVGALAGSTIMLLTLPWVIAIMVGRVDMNDKGEVVGYTKKTGQRLTQGLDHSGIQFKDGVKRNSKLMALTSLGYLFIQIPALLVDDMQIYGNAAQVDIGEVMDEAKAERPFAWCGLAFSTVLFLAYVYLQYACSDEEAPPADPGKNEGPAALEVGTPYVAVDAGGAQVGVPYFQMMINQISPAPHRAAAGGLVDSDRYEDLGVGLAISQYQEAESERMSSLPYAPDTPLVRANKPLPAHIISMVISMYNKYAALSKPKNNISYTDMCTMVRKLGLKVDNSEIEAIYVTVDTDSNKSLDKREFMEFFNKLIAKKRDRSPTSMSLEASPVSKEPPDDEEDSGDEEEEELPEEFQNLPPEEQASKITIEACKSMIGGTILVLVFTDPMVDVLSQIGKVIHISPFFVSFILAPLASNASELIAAAKLAGKKTAKTITIALQSLEGAACMNNTFCLAIFYALIVKQGLAWKFTAETGVILIVQFIMTGLVLFNPVQNIKTAGVIFSLYPLSLLFVAICNSYLSLD